jgi:hypothetical protein
MTGPAREGLAMLIDCDGCVMRDVACGDCVVSFLLGPPDQRLDEAEQTALAVLAQGGLVPPLRLHPGGGQPDGAGERGSGARGPGARGPGAGPRRGAASA